MKILYQRLKYIELKDNFTSTLLILTGNYK